MYAYFLSLAVIFLASSASTVNRTDWELATGQIWFDAVRWAREQSGKRTVTRQHSAIQPMKNEGKILTRASAVFRFVLRRNLFILKQRIWDLSTSPFVPQPSFSSDCTDTPTRTGRCDVTLEGGGQGERYVVLLGAPPQAQMVNWWSFFLFLWIDEVEYEY